MIDMVIERGYRPDAKRRGCADCRHMRGAVSWWCKSPDAVARRGTSIPGVLDCQNWEPAPSMDDLSWPVRLWVRVSLSWLVVKP